MNVYDGSTDQYVTDTLTRYPAFSDISPTEATAGSFEQKYTMEQQMYPSYYHTRGDGCAAIGPSHTLAPGPSQLRAPAPMLLREQSQMGPALVDRAHNGANVPRASLVTLGWPPGPSHSGQPAPSRDSGAGEHKLSNILLLFFLIVAVFICCYLAHTVENLLERMEVNLQGTSY